MQTIAIQSIKGGVGKTTTAISLVGGFLKINPKLRILLIDCDQQASIKSYFRLKLMNSDFDCYDFVIKGADYRQCIQKISFDTDVSSFDVMLSSKKLADAEIQLVTFPRREETLRTRFEEQNIADAYDIVLYDCPPSLNLLTFNVLLNSNHLVIPCAMDTLSVVGVMTVLENLSLMERHFKHKPNIIGVLPTFYDKRAKISDIVLNELNKYAERVPILSPIRIDTKLKNAQLRKKTIFEYDESSRSAEDYLSLANNILKNMSLVSTNLKRSSKSSEISL